MSLEECTEKAREGISTAGYCILAYDIIGSSRLAGIRGRTFWDRWKHMNLDITNKFKHYLYICPDFKEDAHLFRGLTDKFEIIGGDQASACVISAQGVKEIIQYQMYTYPEIPLRFVVGTRYDDPVLKRI